MIPTSLCITIKTNISQTPIAYKSANTLRGRGGHGDKSATSKPLFNPFVKMSANQLAKLPKERVPGVFFSIDEFNRMMESLRTVMSRGAVLDASGALLNQSSKSGIIDDNIQLTLDALFPLGGAFYDEFGDEYTIVGKHWTKGNWLMNLSMVPNLDEFGLGRPFDQFNIATFNPNDIKVLISALPEDAQMGRAFVVPKLENDSKLWNPLTYLTKSNKPLATSTPDRPPSPPPPGDQGTTQDAPGATSNNWGFLSGIFGNNNNVSQKPSPAAQSQPEPTAAQSQPEPTAAQSQPEPPAAQSQPEPTAAQSQPEPTANKNTLYTRLFGSKDVTTAKPKTSIFTRIFGNRQPTQEEYINKTTQKMEELIKVAEKRLESIMRGNMWYDMCAIRDKTNLTEEQRATCANIDVKKLDKILTTNTNYWRKANRTIKEIHDAVQQNNTPGLEQLKTDIAAMYFEYRKIIAKATHDNAIQTLNNNGQVESQPINAPPPAEPESAPSSASEDNAIPTELENTANEEDNATPTELENTANEEDNATPTELENTANEEDNAIPAEPENAANEEDNAIPTEPENTANEEDNAIPAEPDMDIDEYHTPMQSPTLQAPSEPEKNEDASFWGQLTNTLGEFTKDLGGLNSQTSSPQAPSDTVSNTSPAPTSTPDDEILAKLYENDKTLNKNRNNWTMSKNDTETHFSHLINNIKELDAQLDDPSLTDEQRADLHEKYITNSELFLNQFDRFEQAPNISDEVKKDIQRKFSPDVKALNHRKVYSTSSLAAAAESDAAAATVGGAGAGPPAAASDTKHQYPFNIPDKYAPYGAYPMAAPYVYPYPWGYHPQNEQPKRRTYTDKMGVCYVVPITLELHRGKLSEADLKRLPCYNKQKNIAEDFNTLVGRKIMNPQFNETVKEATAAAAPTAAAQPLPLPAIPEAPALAPMPPPPAPAPKKGGGRGKSRRHRKSRIKRQAKSKKHATINDMAKLLHLVRGQPIKV